MTDLSTSTPVDNTALPTATTYAAQVLHKAADLLDADPDEQLARHIRDQVMEWADRAVTRSLPANATAPARGFATAEAALPPIDGATHSRYATALRAAAEADSLRGGDQ